MELTPFRDSSPILSQPDELRARLAEEGYLFVRGLLPAGAVQAVGDATLALCRQQGWADEAGRALGEPRLEGHDGWWDVYDPLQRMEAFHALAHRQEMVGLAEAIIGEPVLVHPRNIGRITFPGAAYFTTPPHQDFPLIQGTPDTYTAWMPLVDCPISLGGLAVLPRSHRSGRLQVRSATGPGGLTVDHASIGTDWRGQDLLAGDVLFFHSHTIHQALPNLSEDGLRVSVDYRYQALSEPIVDDSLLPHYMRLSWDEVYEGWQDPSIQYYWQRQPVRVIGRDVTIMQPA